MARLEEGAECEGGRLIASFLLSLGSATKVGEGPDLAGP